MHSGSRWARLPLVGSNAPSPEVFQRGLMRSQVFLQIVEIALGVATVRLGELLRKQFELQTSLQQNLDLGPALVGHLTKFCKKRTLLQTCLRLVAQKS